MASIKIIAFVILLALLQEGYGSKRVKREGNNDNSEHRLKKRHRIILNHKIRRDASGDCPPPPGQGTLQISNSDMEAYKSIYSGNGTLAKIMFMCGLAQIVRRKPTYKIPEFGDGSDEIKWVQYYDETTYDVPLCCDGYVTNENDVCVPDCKGGCKDGLCVAPGKCACYQGYIMNELGQCVLKCPCECPNGQCRGDKCVCNAGYIPDKASQTCTAVCETGCVHGECTSPNTCTCHRGYKKDPSGDSHICVPKCGACNNGRCVSPNICQCNDGYIFSEDLGNCVPRCNGCEHGKCVAPWTCKCYKGYKRIDEVCQPICRNPCVHATCVAPSKCKCDRGYIPEQFSNNVCELGCTPECKNAECVARNFCLCHDGYMKKNNSMPHICYDKTIVLLEAARNDLKG